MSLEVGLGLGRFPLKDIPHAQILRQNFARLYPDDEDSKSGNALVEGVACCLGLRGLKGRVKSHPSGSSAEGINQFSGGQHCLFINSIMTENLNLSADQLALA
jgi:hypothetical protein